jgi:mono/diheme cytochrome c family protein
MRKNWIGAAVAAALVCAGSGASAETLLGRGAYLMHSIVACGDCHTPKGPKGDLPGMELAGGFVIDGGPEFTAVAPNITPDRQTGIGTWTDAQIITAIREGRRPDGTMIGPPMPIDMYHDMSDRDVHAIVAYLRHVKPVHNVVAKSQYHIPLPASYGPPLAAHPDVPRADKVRYGAYLAGPLGHCMECHTPLVRGVPDLEHRAGAGGNKFQGPFGISVSRNITPDPVNGIGKWTFAQFKATVSTGIGPNGERLKPPMGYDDYKKMTNSDFEAIWAYLRTLKPLAGP